MVHDHHPRILSFPKGVRPILLANQAALLPARPCRRKRNGKGASFNTRRHDRFFCDFLLNEHFSRAEKQDDARLRHVLNPKPQGSNHLVDLRYNPLGIPNKKGEYRYGNVYS
tara:strand:- start:289 stop:624 length:336 start_codon:yes stop_codon:yes gene_type:complete